jgi:hypothetical protein
MPPDWFVAAMPHGYQTRLAEIQRLTAELQEMDRFGRALLETGARLGDVVGDVFAVMKYDVHPMVANDTSNLVVKLDNKRRLLMSASAEEGPIERKSAEVARVFGLLHEHAEPTDRVVLVANIDPMVPPPQRVDPVTPDALAFLQRLGVNIVTGPLMFALWSLSLQESNRAQKCVDRLHAQDGGAYALPTY